MSRVLVYNEINIKTEAYVLFVMLPFFKASDGNRTRDLLTTNEVRYRLCHASLSLRLVYNIRISNVCKVEMIIFGFLVCDVHSFKAGYKRLAFSLILDTALSIDFSDLPSFAAMLLKDIPSKYRGSTVCSILLKWDDSRSLSSVVFSWLSMTCSGLVSLPASRFSMISMSVWFTVL